MARPPLPVGTYGRISTAQQPSRSWRAAARVRDSDGQTRTVQVFADTKAKAETKLRKKLKTRSASVSEAGAVTPDARLSVLLDTWLIEIGASDRSPQTVEQYARAARILVEPYTGVGNLRVRECTTSRMDAWLKATAIDRPAVAKVCKVALVGALGMAVRHGALTINPIREVAPIRGARKAPRALTGDERVRLRERVRAWESGARMPEDTKPRPSGGPSRATGLVDRMNILLGTGMRIGELLALRWPDVDLDAKAPRLTVSATVVQLTGVGGLIWQEHTKTDAGFRTILLPKFAVDILTRIKGGTTSNELDLVFPSSTGTLQSENNLNRQWREARGLEFDWVTWKTFRKTAATLIDNEASTEDAAAQLGHSGTTVTKNHYIEKAALGPDVRDILERLGDQ